jgi:hypothetical protein
MLDKGVAGGEHLTLQKPTTALLMPKCSGGLMPLLFSRESFCHLEALLKSSTKSPLTTCSLRSCDLLTRLEAEKVVVLQQIVESLESEKVVSASGATA